jgi:hypothetical protein
MRKFCVEGVNREEARTLWSGRKKCAPIAVPVALLYKGRCGSVVLSPILAIAT